jgi:hypothetical protein
VIFHLLTLSQGEVGRADFGGGEDGEEGGAGAGGFDLFASALFAVDEAEDAGDGHAGLAGGFDGGDGAAAGGADIVDDDDAGAGGEEAFDLAAGAVGLFGFADEEAVDEGVRKVVVKISDSVSSKTCCFKLIWTCHKFAEKASDSWSPCGGAGDVRDEGVGSHGEAAYCFCLRDVLADEVVEDEAGEAAAFGVEGGDATVDVVVGLLAAGEGEVAEFEGESGNEMEQGGLVVSRHGVLQFVLSGGYPPIASA